MPRLLLLCSTFSVAFLIPHHNQNVAFAQEAAARDRCEARVEKVAAGCPPGWNIVEDERHRVTEERSVTIGDFVRAGTDRSLTRPAGRATIKISSMPRIYRNVGEWIHAGTKLVPEAVHSKERLTNKSAGDVEAVCLQSPASDRHYFFRTCYFELKGVPVAVELVHGPDAPKAREYRRALEQVMEDIHPL